MKYLAIDVDGTLVDSDGRIGNKTKIEIQRFKQHGHGNIIIASGRHYRNLIALSRELDLGYKDYLVCCDGQYITNAEGNMIWENLYLDSSDLRTIGQIKSNIFCFYTEKEDYVIERNFFKYIVKKMMSLMNARNQKIVSQNYCKHTDINRIQKIVVDSFVGQVEESTTLGRYEVNHLKNNRIEILKKGVNKYEALCYLMKIEGFTSDDMIYFGDDLNDRMCFEKIRYCVAMADAPDELKSKAYYITKKCDEDGVGDAIEQLIFRE